MKLPFRDTAAEKKAAAKRWWQPLQRMFKYADNNLELTIELIKLACAEHKERRLNLSAPQSIENSFIDLHRRQSSGELGIW